MAKEPRGGGLSLNVVLTAAVVVVAVLVIGGVLLFGGGSDDEVVPAEVLHPEGSHTLTEAEDGEVTVVEFLDFQCGACAGFYQNITRDLERDYEGEITFVVRNLPLDMHPLAEPAAYAAEAAALQDSYSQMYHALFDNYTEWARDDSGQRPSDDAERARELFAGYAEDIGLDVERFREDMDSRVVRERVDRDRADAEDAGASGTPTFFVNGVKFEPEGSGFQAIDTELRETIDEELGR
ncbi:DsbA family protein [Haloechinothrix alba]|uniref:DsbA family protein n=1 Tax=Haloechinothrix alba TaxID=664784 RepID=UPI001FECC233|nr:thioredoxin domain-containing protein [Haloechinothrix alba]